MDDQARTNLKRHIKRAIDYAESAEKHARQSENYGHAKMLPSAIDSATRARRDAENAKSELDRIKRIVASL